MPKYNIQNGTLVQRRNEAKKQERSAQITRDLISDAKTLAAHNEAQERAARDLFLERRAAMRHAIRVLRERAVDNIDRQDASTLEIWLEELHDENDAIWSSLVGSGRDRG